MVDADAVRCGSCSNVAVVHAVFWGGMGNSKESGTDWVLCEHHAFEELAHLIAHPDLFLNGYVEGIRMASVSGELVGGRFRHDPWEPYQVAWDEADARGLIARRSSDPM